MSINEANTMAPVQPQPILFAANGEFMNLVPRAVRAISATKTGLTALGVADADVPYWTLPLNGSLSGTKFDVSYKTAGGRLEVSYNSRTNKESVTIMGLPARPSVTWSYDCLLYTSGTPAEERSDGLAGAGRSNSVAATTNPPPIE